VKEKIKRRGKNHTFSLNLEPDLNSYFRLSDKEVRNILLKNAYLHDFFQMVQNISSFTSFFSLSLVPVMYFLSPVLGAVKLSRDIFARTDFCSISSVP
jgi:hypothetical protein